jgi:hypothetical protein
MLILVWSCSGMMGLISSHQAEPLGDGDGICPSPERIPLGLRLKPQLMRSSRYVLSKTLAVVIQFEVIRWPFE